MKVDTGKGEAVECGTFVKQGEQFNSQYGSGVSVPYPEGCTPGQVKSLVGSGVEEGNNGTKVIGVTLGSCALARKTGEEGSGNNKKKNESPSVRIRIYRDKTQRGNERNALKLMREGRDEDQDHKVRREQIILCIHFFLFNLACLQNQDKPAR